MNCRPAPENTCGTLLNDSCVVITGSWPFPCEAPVSGCYRQSEFNEYVGPKLCTLSGYVTTLRSSVDLSTLTGCASLTPVKTTVHAEFQNLYTAVCSLKTDLSLPITGIDTKCLVDPCGDPITTLGELLQAMVDAICCIGAEVPSASGCII